MSSTSDNGLIIYSRSISWEYAVFRSRRTHRTAARIRAFRRTPVHIPALLSSRNPYQTPPVLRSAPCALSASLLRFSGALRSRARLQNHRTGLPEGAVWHKLQCRFRPRATCDIRFRQVRQYPGRRSSVPLWALHCAVSGSHTVLLSKARQIAWCTVSIVSPHMYDSTIFEKSQVFLKKLLTNLFWRGIIHMLF